MNWNAIMQIFNAIFVYCWLIAILWLAWQIYRSGVARTAHVARMEKMLTDVVQSNATAAISAAENARTAVETVHNLVALLAKEEPNA